MAPVSLLCTIHGLSGPLLFTLYYSLWKISRNLDFMHRGPPTLNVGQQIYCFFFTIYYLLFRTESENSLHRGQPTQQNGQNGPLLFTVLFLISRNRDFLHRGQPTQKNGQNGPLLFTLYYSLWKISRSRDFLHRGQPTQKNGPNGPFLFTLWFLHSGQPTLKVAGYFLLWEQDRARISFRHRGATQSAKRYRSDKLGFLHMERPIGSSDVMSWFLKS